MQGCNLRSMMPKPKRWKKGLAELTGESLNDAIRHAIQARLEQIVRSQGIVSRVEELDRIALKCARLPRRDQRISDEIIGYDDWGVFRA